MHLLDASGITCLTGEIPDQVRDDAIVMPGLTPFVLPGLTPFVMPGLAPLVLPGLAISSCRA